MVPMKLCFRYFFVLMTLWLGLNSSLQAQVDGYVKLNELPPEARHTLQLIKQGGPFPYEKDGSVFRNYEKILPKKQRGYYREYTVKTPYARNRGARRIVVGGEPALDREFYYTADHYASFRRIKE
jgi:ribonuclease T1